MKALLLAACLGWTLLVAGACGGPEPSGPTEPVDVSAPVRATGPDRTTTVVAVGDIACAPDEQVTPESCQQEATARLTTALAPDAVIALGDLQYESGSISDFMGSYDDSWGSLRGITRPLPGNHEYNSDHAGGYFAYVDQSQPWYAWDAGKWRIYMLNSNCGEVDCAAEQDWLRADLAANPRQCSAIAMHHPRYSSGKHHSDESLSGFWQIAYDNHVDLALAGHDHDYERFAPLDANGNVSPGRGITSFVSGTGGRSLYSEYDVAPGSAYFQNTHFGVLSLTLAADGFSWEYTTTDRSVLDKGSAPCV
jgi:acid phosphatase type 7